MAALLVILAIVGCTSDDSDSPTPPVVNNGRVAVDLALCVSTTAGSSSATTRMAADKVQASGNFRGIQDLKAYALNNENTQQGCYTNLTQVSATQHYFSNQIDLSIGTNRFLCYARAIPGTDAQASQNGAVTANYNETDYTQNTFELVQINLNADYSNANAMAAYLTDIANASSATDWTTSELYTTFISQGHYIAGSSANLIALVTQLKEDLETLTTTEGRTAVLEKIGTLDNINEKLNSSTPYPASIGLPDGAAAVKWDESQNKFVAVTSFASGTPLSDHSRFVFPPELYYYIESPIKTATSSLKNEYTDAAWSNVLEKYPSDDATVSSSTRSVAVKKALDYAVGCLKVYVKAEAELLVDNTDENVDISAHNFTLTGIILGGQYMQDYQFTPKLSQTPSNTDEKIIYDNIYDKDVPTGIQLTTSGTETPVYTLAFQSRDEKPIDIVLEFMNNGDAFTGEGGIVHKNTKFYLVGQIWPEPEKVSQGEYYNRVFTKDYTTKVMLNIQSLKHAYNVIPDLKTAAYSIKVDNVAVTPWTDGGTQNHELYNW